MIKKYLIIVGLISLFLCVIPLILFILNFNDQEISSTITAWGSFGDYIGGIINPIVGLINIIVLVYLTLKISEIDNKYRSFEEKNRNSERLYTYRLACLKELNEIRHKLYIVDKKDLSAKGNTTSLKIEFNDIINLYNGIFKTFKDSERISKLSKELEVFSGNYQESERAVALFSYISLLKDISSEMNQDLIFFEQNKKIGS